MGAGSGANGSYFPHPAPRPAPGPSPGYGYAPASTGSPPPAGLSTGYAPVPHFMSAPPSNNTTPSASPHLGTAEAFSNNPYGPAASPLMGNGSMSASTHSSMSSSSPSMGNLKDDRRRSLHARSHSQRQIVLKAGAAYDIGVREKYGGGGLGWGMPGGPDRAGPLSPKTPDAMHDMGRPLPRTGRSRYIIEKDAFGAFTLWSLRGWLNISSRSPLAVSGIFADLVTLVVQAESSFSQEASLRFSQAGPSSRTLALTRSRTFYTHNGPVRWGKGTTRLAGSRRPERR